MKPLRLKGTSLFKNRHFHVKLVKDQDSDEPVVPAIAPIDPLEIIGALVGGAALLIGIYVATDTLRRVAVHTAETKIK